MSRRDPDEWILEIESALTGRDSNRELSSPKFVRQRGWMPKVDVLESEQHLLIRAELAGVTHQNIQIGFNQERNSLTIKGNRPDDLCNRAEPLQAHLLEIEEGSFLREILLPKGQFIWSRIQAQHKNGILTITIPKDSSEQTILVVEQITIHRP